MVISMDFYDLFNDLHGFLYDLFNSLTIFMDFLMGISMATSG